MDLTIGPNQFFWPAACASTAARKARTTSAT